MPGLRSLVARRRSALGSPPDVSVPTPPHSQQNSPCAEESSVVLETEDISSTDQTEVNGYVNHGKESSCEKNEKTDHPEVIVSAQEKEVCAKVSESISNVSDSKHCDMVNGSATSVNQGGGNNGKESEKTQIGNESNQEQIKGEDGSSVMSNKSTSNEHRNEKTGSGSAGLMAQIQGSVSGHVNRSAMEIESTLAKRGVTIVRRLVNCKDTNIKPKIEVTQRCAKDSLVLNGTVITANPINAGKNIESRLGRIASSLKGTSITLNSRGLLGLRGGATVNRNPVGRPPNNLRDINQRNSFRSRGTPHLGPRGPRHQTPSGFPSQLNARGALSQSRLRPSLRPSFPRASDRNLPLDVNAKGLVLDTRRPRGVGTVSSVNSNERTTSSVNLAGAASRVPVNSSNAFPSPKCPSDYADHRKAGSYSSPRRGFSHPASPQSWSGASGPRSFASQQRPVTPHFRGTVPSPQSRSSAMSPQSCSATSPQSSVISPRSNSSVPSPQSKVTGSYQLKSAEASPYSRAQEVSPVSRSTDVSPQPRAPELSPSSRCTEVSPQSRTADISPISRSVEASPQHRPTGITPQTRYPVGFSPQSRTAELSPASGTGTLGSHSLSSATGVSPQSHMTGLTAQSVPIGLSSGVSTAPHVNASSLRTDTVRVPSQSNMGLLTQPANSVGLTQGTLPFGQPQQNNSRFPGTPTSLGFTGLSGSSGFAGRTGTDSYIAGSDSSKFPIQPNLEGFPSQINPGGFPLHSSPGGFPTQTDLPAYPGVPPSCGFPQVTSGGQFPSQNGTGLPDQMNAEAFNSQSPCTTFNQVNSGYPPHSSSGGYPMASSTNEFHESSPGGLGYPSPRTFPLHANSREYPGYPSSENAAPQEISSHTSPRELPVTHNTREVLQNCNQGLSVNPAAGDSINGRASQLQSSYNEALVHPSYHEQNTYPRSNPDLSVLPEFRDPSQHDYREPSLISTYRGENIPNSFRDTPLHNSPRTTQTVSNYRELSLMPGINDMPPQTSPRGSALHNNYKEQTVQNSYGSYVDPNLANYRETINQTGQQDQALPSFRETVAHTSPREQVLPGFRETLDAANCREQLHPGYRETLNQTSPGEQVPPTFSENVDHNSPRSEGLPGFNESLNLRSQVLPGFNDTVNHENARVQSQTNYRSVDFNNFRDPIDQTIGEPALHSRMRDTVPYNCEYAEGASQNHIVEQSHSRYAEFRDNAQHIATDNAAVENAGSRNLYTKSVLPSFTESFECGNSSEYQKDGNMLHTFPESASYVNTRRNSECTRYDGPPFSSCAQSTSYSPTYSSESSSPDGSYNRTPQCQQSVNDKPVHATPSHNSLLSQPKHDTTNNTNEVVSDDVSKHNHFSHNAGVSGPTDLLEKVGITNPSTSQENSKDLSMASNTTSLESQSTDKVKEPPMQCEESTVSTSLPSSPSKYATVGSPSKLGAGLSPSSQERIVIKMKLLHSESRHESEKHKRGDVSDQTKTPLEQRDPSNYPSVKYTRWTIDSIINGREDGADDKVPYEENKDDVYTTDEEEEVPSEDRSSNKEKASSSETPTNLDTNKNLMKPLKITIPNPLRTRSHNEVPVDSLSPCSSRVTRRSSKFEIDLTKESHGYPIRKLKVKNIPLASSSLPITSNVENPISPISASVESYKKRRRRRSRRNSESSEASVSSVTSVLSEENDQSVVAQMKKCSIVIKRIYSEGNNSCYSSTLCSKRPIEKYEKTHTRPKRKAALEASERCHKSLRSADNSDIKSNKIPYNGAFFKSKQLMPVNLKANNAEIKDNIITQCSVILYDVFMNRRINSMTCPGCSRNYDSSDSVQVNISKATISLLCSVCQWLVVKDVHPHEVHSVAAS